ncbi:MAG: helix-turn-helix domain-containing protein [Rhodocyclaceae bacterium]|nr:helix-turn-helix domain-containing protein [Rhodocyclaceae bacterium]
MDETTLQILMTDQGALHPEVIKALLKIRGSSSAKIARDCGCSDVAVFQVIEGNSRSARIARRICEVTRVLPDMLWPGKYPEFEVNPVQFQKAA